jgi:hypothetical protein
MVTGVLTGIAAIGYDFGATRLACLRASLIQIKATVWQVVSSDMEVMQREASNAPCCTDRRVGNRNRII